MDRAPLSALAIWVLVVLADGPAHSYRICGRIAAVSMMTFVPKRGSVGSAVARLARAGLIVEGEWEPGNGSRYGRLQYALSNQRWTALRRERHRMAFATQATDRVLARSMPSTFSRARLPADRVVVW
jgi:DNA-binding PadR family transcriptional regulator